MPIILNKKEIVNTYFELNSMRLPYIIENPLHGVPQSREAYNLTRLFFISFFLFFFSKILRHAPALLQGGDTMTGAAIERQRHKHQRLRTDLQKRGTLSAKRHLKELAGKQHRFQSDVNHCI